MAPQSVAQGLGLVADREGPLHPSSELGGGARGALAEVVAELLPLGVAQGAAPPAPVAGWSGQYAQARCTVLRNPLLRGPFAHADMLGRLLEPVTGPDPPEQVQPRPDARVTSAQITQPKHRRGVGGAPPDAKRPPARSSGHAGETTGNSGKFPYKELRLRYELVARLYPRAIDATASDPGAVPAPEVFDQHATVSQREATVAPRDHRDRDAEVRGRRAPDHQRARARRVRSPSRRRRAADTAASSAVSNPVSISTLDRVEPMSAILS